MITLDEMSNNPFRFGLSFQRESESECMKDTPHERVAEGESELRSRAERGERHPE